MKKLFLITALALVAFTSCKKDEDKKIDVVGTWTYEKTVMITKVPVLGEVSSEAVLDSGDIIFTEDGKYTNTAGTIGTYSLSGKELTTTIAGTTETYKASVSGSKLTLEQSQSAAGVSTKNREIYVKK